MKTIRYSVILVLLAILTAGQSVQAQRSWGPQTKGTVIGAGVGAAAGAIINKRNRAVGGVIGGVAGGAAGYAIGKRIDNKNKERARVAAAERAAAERELAAKRAAEQEATDVESRPELASGAMNRTYTASAPAPYQRAKATQPTDENSAKAILTPYVLSTGFLPNDTYGDPNTPYSTSEIRRKSW